MPVKARRYFGTKTHDNDYFNIKWYNNWHMDTITLLKPIDRDSNIRVNVEFSLNYFIINLLSIYFSS